MAEEESQQKSADVRAIDIGIRHEDDAMVAEPDDNKRLPLLQQKMKTIADELMAVPLIYDHRLYAAQQNVQDLGWSYGQNAQWWDPVNAWLSK